MIHDYNGTSETISYSYTFSFEDGSEREFHVKLDKKTLELIEPPDETYPEWAKLENEQCPNCPLNTEEVEFCPVAVSISDMIEFVGNKYSYDEVDITVKTQNRTYLKHTTMQKGVSSLLGLFMVTSGCPILERLKPMVRHHLPFATLTENSYRVISMYLVSQFFVYKRGQEPDWNMRYLLEMYDEIHKVNKSFWRRLTHLKFKDAGVNALIMLDNTGSHIQFLIDAGHLEEIEFLCDKYFKHE